MKTPLKETEMLRLFAVIALLIFSSASAKAEKINLTADEKVEWHQNEQKMVAVGNAVATKKDMNVRADKMTGYYTSGKGQKSAITSVHAEGGVVATTPTATAYGDTLDYDLSKEEMILIGRPAKIKTATETITAEEKITYYPKEQKAIARGNVVAQNQENKIRSELMVAYFEKNAQGQLEIERVEIFDQAQIDTKSATAYADRGLYLPKTAKAYLYDNVKITQDGNVLYGDKAETNLNTGISKLVTKGKGKRVSGVFKEKSSSKPKQEQSKKQ